MLDFSARIVRAGALASFGGPFPIETFLTKAVVLIGTEPFAAPCYRILYYLTWIRVAGILAGFSGPVPMETFLTKAFVLIGTEPFAAPCYRILYYLAGIHAYFVVFIPDET
jgi:hypothetical protein